MGLDSMKIFDTVERYFKVSLSEDEVDSINTVGDIADCVSRHIVFKQEGISKPEMMFDILKDYVPAEFGGGVDDSVLTNADLERRGTLPGDRVTFVACVGSRKGAAGCSRYCCESMVGQALRLRRMGKKVRVLYRDIRTFSRQAEELYEQAAREEGEREAELKQLFEELSRWSDNTPHKLIIVQMVDGEPVVPPVCLDGTTVFLELLQPDQFRALERHLMCDVDEGDPIDQIITYLDDITKGKLTSEPEFCGEYFCPQVPSTPTR